MKLCLVGALVAATACGTDPEPPPSLVRTVTGTVRDSLGAGVRKIYLQGVLWHRGDSAASGYAFTGGGGDFKIEWFTPVPFLYDSLTLDSDLGELSSSATVACRPYGNVRLARTAAQLTDLPDDSVHLALEVGLARAPAALARGLSCAMGYSPFGPDATSTFRFALTIDSFGTAAPDSLWGQWEILFSETRIPAEGAFAGAIGGDTVDLALGVSPGVYSDCDPGWRLRLALEEGQRLGNGFITTATPGVPQCPIEHLDPLRFVEMVGDPFFTAGSQ